MSQTENRAGETVKVARITGESMGAAAAQASAFAETGAAQARAAVERGTEAATRVTEGAYKMAEEVAEFSRGNAEALSQATQAYLLGAQDLGRQAFAMVQGLTDHALAGARALSGAKSLKEAAELQASFARGAMDRMLSESAKMQEASLRLTEQVMAPMTRRVTVAVEKASRPLAA